MLASSSVWLLLRPTCQQHQGCVSQPPNRSWQVTGAEESQSHSQAGEPRWQSEGRAEGGLRWAVTVEALNTRSITAWTPTAIYTPRLEINPRESKDQGEAAINTPCLKPSSSQISCLPRGVTGTLSFSHPTPSLGSQVIINILGSMLIYFISILLRTNIYWALGEVLYLMLVTQGGKNYYDSHLKDVETETQGPRDLPKVTQWTNHRAWDQSRYIAALSGEERTFKVEKILTKERKLFPFLCKRIIDLHEHDPMCRDSW